jgi:hypothetical protein
VSLPHGPPHTFRTLTGARWITRGRYDAEAYARRTCNATQWGSYWPVPFGRAVEAAGAPPPLEGARLHTVTGAWAVVREEAGRKDVVRQAMRHAWEGYVKYAWGFDELKPVSRRGVNNFGGFGLTIVDSLSTLWLMEMHQVRFGLVHKDELHRVQGWWEAVVLPEKNC